MASLLFNFYINSMVGHLQNTDFNCYSLAGRHIFVLIYTDDAVKLSKTLIGLKREVRVLVEHCKEDQLELSENQNHGICPKTPKSFLEYRWSTKSSRSFVSNTEIVFHFVSSRKLMRAMSPLNSLRQEVTTTYP